MHLDDCDWVTYDYGGEQMGPCDCGEPARVLAWCSAMRAIVEEHAPQDRTVWVSEVVTSGPECFVCADWENEDMDGPPHMKAPCRTLLLVAQALGVSVEE